MSPGWELTLGIVGGVASIAVILDYFGIKPNALAWGSIMALSQKWKFVVMLGLVGLTRCFSGYGFYRSLQPKIVERIVERPVEKIVEREVPQECPKLECPKVAKSSNQGPKVKRPESTATPPLSQECAPGAKCGQSSGQQGGITAGEINIGPPPMEIKFSAEAETSTKSEFPYETKITISTSVAYTPVSLAIVCDVALSPQVTFDFGTNASMLSTPSSGLTLEDNKIAWVKFGGTAISRGQPALCPSVVKTAIAHSEGWAG